MNKYTNNEICNSYALWCEYVDTGAVGTEAEFDAMTLAERLQFMADCGMTDDSKKGAITWSAKNSSSRLNGSRPARTVLGAVRAAIAYANGELGGEGVITIMEDGETIRDYRAGLVHGSPRGKWVRTEMH